METPCAGILLLDLVEFPVCGTGEGGIYGAHGQKKEAGVQRSELSGARVNKCAQRRCPRGAYH